MRLRLVVLAVSCGFLAADALAQGKWEGTGLSADFKQTFEDPGQEDQSGRFYLDSEGMRMEMTEEGRAMVTIMRFQENDMLMLMPDAKMYMIMPLAMMGQDENATLESKFASACAEYAVAKRVGSESINGRDTEKWRCEDSTNDDADADIWFDEEIGAPILVVDEDGGRFELSNIEEGNQPSGLFQPPADYKPMSMQDMMQMNMDR